MVKVLSIIGATASGKSDLAIKVAKKFNGEIVSCDSVQIYKYFNIGSAKPNLQELQKTPHHLIDALEPTEICTAGLWKDKAIIAVNDIIARGKTPIIVGGTGLYLKTLYLGHQVHRVCYDKDNDRFVLSLQNNLNQFAYLDLDGVL